MVSARNVVEIEGDAPVKIQRDEVVRICPGGIAGARSRIKIDGPAVATEQHVRRVTDGHLLCGPSGLEYELTPTGVGPIEVEVTVTNPTSPTPEIKTYQIEVQ